MDEKLQPPPPPPTNESARLPLILAAALVLVLWQVPYGQHILYPFSLLATYAHEMGHGITALITGGSFESFVMYPDGSGLATWTGGGRLRQAMVAAGGLLGPTIAGAAILVASRRPKRARWVLFALALGMALSVPLFVRNFFGVLFVLGMAVAIGLSAKLFPRFAPFLAQLLGVVLCVALFRDLDYMFSSGGVIAGEQRLSDSGAIAEALFLPYWFWGALVAATAVIVLCAGLWAALRSNRPAAHFP